jgi:hypothetical protein
MYHTEIPSERTPLVGLAVVKVSELQRVQFMSYEVPKVPCMFIFGYIGWFIKIRELNIWSREL